MTPLLAFLIPLTLYLLFPSSMWNFDGVACAIALEAGNPVYFFHGNHLLYGFLGYGFWQLLQPLGLSRALPALQMFTSLLSAGGLVGLFFLARRLLKNRWLSLAIVLCFSVTAVFWVWSVEAQVYSLGFLAIAWATVMLFQEDCPVPWRRVGLLQGLAVLGHVIHLLWTIPALYWLVNTGGGTARWRNARNYLGCLALTVLIPYLLVLGFVIIPRHPQGPWIIQWLLGSAALTTNHQFAWHGRMGLVGFWPWFCTTGRFFWGNLWPYGAPLLSRFVLGLLMFVSATGFVYLLQRSWSDRRNPRWIFSALWLGIYGLFLWTWEPATECYRLSDCVPWIILCSIGLTRVKGYRLSLLGLTGLFLATLGLNAATRIIPMADARRNLLYQEMIALSQKTPVHSLYLTADAKSQIYALYFLQRTALTLQSSYRRGESWPDFLRKRQRLGPVYVSQDVQQNEAAAVWLRTFKSVPIPESPWIQLL